MGFGGRRGGWGGASAASARNITRHLLQSSAYYNDGARVNVCVCVAPRFWGWINMMHIWDLLDILLNCACSRS